MSNKPFQEYEIWKILKAGALALRDWQKVYPDIDIGLITPLNFVFNETGKIKLVSCFSFPEHANR